jgi:O-antigen/teichoic acid export membrane protein
MMFMVINGVLTGALQGIQQLKVVALADAASKLALLGLVALFLFQGFGVRSVAIAYVLSDAMAFVWLLLAVRRNVGLRGPVKLGTWRSLLSGGMPFMIWETALLTYARVDVILLSLFTTSAVLGWYYAAYRIISIPLFLPVVIMTVIFPALSANARNPDTFNAFARRGVLIAALTSMPMAVGLMLIGDKVIALFGYPESFSNSVVPIILLAAGLPMVAVNMVVASSLNALDKQRTWALIGVGAALLNVGVNLVAIPLTQREFGNGGIGAAAVTTLTEVYLTAAGLFFLPRSVLDRGTFLAVFKCLAAGLAMAGVLWLAHGFSIFLLVPLGGLVYGAAVLALGVVGANDIRFIRRQLLSRGAPAIDPPA